MSRFLVTLISLAASLLLWRCGGVSESTMYEMNVLIQEGEALKEELKIISERNTQIETESNKLAIKAAEAESQLSREISNRKTAEDQIYILQNRLQSLDKKMSEMTHPVHLSSTTHKTVVDENKIFGDIVRNLEEGTVVFHYPDDINQGTIEIAEARLTFKLSSEIMAGFLTEKGKTEIFATPLSSVVKVHLEGEGFEISPKEPIESIIPESQYQTWVWKVRPINAGELILTLKIESLVRSKNYGEKPFQKTLNKSVKVHVNPIWMSANFLDNNWQYVVSTIVGSGIIGWMYKRFSKKKK